MPNVGPMELLIVLVIALVIFGPRQLPELGRSLGSGMREFKDSISDRRTEQKPGGRTERKGPERTAPPELPSITAEPESLEEGEAVTKQRS